MSDSEPIPTHAMIDNFISGAHFAVVCEVMRALIENDVLNQGEMVARLDRLSQHLMTQAGGRYSSPVVDMARDCAAGELRGAPS